MDALKSAVKAKLPGTRKEFLVSNNFPKKNRNSKEIKKGLKLFVE